MNVTMLRRADRLLGWPLCLALTVVRLLLRPLLRPSAGNPPQRILIIKLSEMGSTVLAWPAVAQLRRRLPNAQVFILTFAENQPIFEAMAFAPPEHIITVDGRSPWHLARSGLGALAALRARHIGATLDFDFFSRFGAVLAFLCCPRGLRVGFDRFTNEGQGRGRLLTHRVLYSPHLHTSAAFMALVEALSASDSAEVRLKMCLDRHDYTLPHLAPEVAALHAVTGTLRTLALYPEAGIRLVLVNPNSSTMIPLRRWPPLHFIALCRRLLEARPDVRIAITGSSDEHAETERLVAQVDSPRCVSVAGRTSLPELLALYSLADLLITNDSGPAHLASLGPLPALVLFGPETPRQYAPLGPNVKALYAGFACSPCVSVYNAKRSPCRNNRCLQAITVDEVLTQTLARLADIPARLPP